MWKSLREYVLSLGHWGWVVAVDLVGSVTGWYLDISNTVDIPMWVWLVPLLAALAIAPFLAFHRMRIDKDRLQSSLTQIRR